MPVPAPDEGPPRTPPRNGRRGSANILAASVPPQIYRRGRGQKSMCRRNSPPATPAAPARETQPARAGSVHPAPLRRSSPWPCRARLIFARRRTDRHLPVLYQGGTAASGARRGRRKRVRTGLDRRNGRVPCDDSKTRPVPRSGFLNRSLELIGPAASEFAALA